MIQHPFVPQDFDDDYCDVAGCDKHFSEHANIEGITNEDDLYDFGDSLSDIKNKIRGGDYDEDWN